MADEPLGAGAVVVSMEGSVLDADAVASIERALGAGAAPGAVDLTPARRCEPDGLGALLALTRSTAPPLRLRGLSRPLLRDALHVGLHEHAVIEPPPPEWGTGGVIAVLHRSPAAPDAGALDVAGRSLLVRQLQWLLSLDARRILVELGSGAAQQALGDWLLSDDPLTARVTPVLSAEPLTPAQIAARAGAPTGSCYLAVPGDVLGDAGLDWLLGAAGQGPAVAHLSPPAGLQLSGATVQTLQVGNEGPPRAVTLDGWACQLRTRAEALRLSCSALSEDTPGIEIHAARTAPGVWVARRAQVSPRAKLTPPVYLGAATIVSAGARVGPCVVVGPDSVLERGCTVREAIVAENTIVGEGLEVVAQYADPQALEDLHTGERTPPAAALSLDPRRPRRPGTLARLVACALLLALALPWSLAALVTLPLGRRPLTRVGRWRLGALGVATLDAVPALLDAAQGRRYLLGVADPQLLRAAPDSPLQAGAIDLTATLWPGDDPTVRGALWRWYDRHKCGKLDRRLLGRRLHPWRRHGAK